MAGNYSTVGIASNLFTNRTSLTLFPAPMELTLKVKDYKPLSMEGQGHSICLTDDPPKAPSGPGANDKKTTAKGGASSNKDLAASLLLLLLLPLVPYL